MQNEKLARMRTIQQCTEHFKQYDPDTAISDYYLRCLVKQNKISHVMAGKKYLINLDKLIEFLNESNQGACVKKDNDSQYGKLRRIEL